VVERVPAGFASDFRTFARFAPSHGSAIGDTREIIMAVDTATVQRIAHLARIAVAEEEVAHLQGELNAMLDFVAQLEEVDVAGVEPMTSVTPMKMKEREDKVTDGNIADAIVANAPGATDHFFVVPKVVE
jgi:aspartyl-tRNA(Asn)/glutamyl-tRNA(Gln) amidotransferase subunit C